MRKILLALKIVQVVDNTKRNEQGLKRLGKGYLNAYRLNPFNPLSYIVVVILITQLFLIDGFKELFKKVENPFRWN